MKSRTCYRSTVGVGVLLVFGISRFAQAQCEPTHYLLGQNMPTSGVNAAIQVLTSAGQRLFLGSGVASATNKLHGETAGPLFSFDGVETTPFPTFDSTSAVNCFGILNNRLFVGGTFVRVPTIPQTCVLQYQDGQWSSVSPAISGIASAMVVCNSRLYVGGAPSLFRSWDGENWTNLDGFLNGDINAMAASGNNLFVCGTFTAAGSVDAVRIAIWDGSDFRRATTGIGPNGVVSKVIAADDGVYVAGDFTQIDGQSASGLARLRPGAFAEPVPPQGVSVRSVARNGHLAGASPNGLYERIDGQWQLVVPFDVTWSIGSTMFGGEEYFFASGPQTSTLAPQVRKLTPSGFVPAVTTLESATRTQLVGQETYLCGSLLPANSSEVQLVRFQNGELLTGVPVPAGISVKCATEHLGEVFIGGTNLASVNFRAVLYKRENDSWVSLIQSPQFFASSGSINDLISADGHLYVLGAFALSPQSGIGVRTAAEYSDSGFVSLGGTVTSVQSSVLFDNSLVVNGSHRWTGAAWEFLGPFGSNAFAPNWVVTHQGRLVGIYLDGTVVTYLGIPGHWDEQRPFTNLSLYVPPVSFGDELLTEIFSNPITFHNGQWKRLASTSFIRGRTLLPSQEYLFAATGTLNAAIHQLQCPCVADLSTDGVIDLFDYLDFVSLFVASNIQADINLDNRIDFFDYLDFLEAFNEGC